MDFLFPFALGAASILAGRYLFAQQPRDLEAEHAKEQQEFAERAKLHAREGTKESTQWIDLIGQYGFQHLERKVTDVVLDRLIKDAIQEELNKKDYGVFIEPIQVKSLCLGNALPVLTNVTVVSSDVDKPLVVDLDVMYRGTAQLSIKSGAGINTAAVKIDAFPVQIDITDLKFNFRTRIEVDLSDLPIARGTMTVAASNPEPLVLFECEPVIGHLGLLDHIPFVQKKLKEAVQSAVRAKLAKELVAPSCKKFETKLW